MQGVSCALIARNESWVRKQAQALARHLPSNVDKADLIQVGLIAVAQAALGFEWQGERDTPEATEAFVRYARSSGASSRPCRSHASGCAAPKAASRRWRNWPRCAG